MTPDGYRQASGFATKSDDPLDSSGHHMLSSNVLLEHNDSTSFEDPDHEPPLDLEETAFMDLFTESEYSQDIGNVVCDRLQPACHPSNRRSRTHL